MKIKFDSTIHLLHGATFGTLATQSTQMPGYPFASILPFVLDEQNRPLFLISALAEHTKNLIADSHASFLVHNVAGQNILTSERASLLGDVVRMDVPPELVARYVRYLPDAAQYLALGDFAFFQFSPKGARYVAGFGQMGWVDETDWGNSAVLPLAEEEKLLHELIEVQPSGVKLLGLDCYGFDIEHAGCRERQRFPNGPLSVDRIGETVKRFLSTM